MNKLIIDCGLYKDDKLIINELKSHIVLSIKYEDKSMMEVVLNEAEINKLKEKLNNFKGK